MARTEVKEHRKFKRLVRMLDIPSISAMGLLEFLWQSGAHACTDFIGDKEDVEAACEWPHEKGRLWPVLKEVGWVDDRDGMFFIHDFFDHCPEYVKARRKRREKRDAPKSDERLSNDNQCSPNDSHSSDERRTLTVERQTNGEHRLTNGASTQHNTTQQNKEEAAAPPRSDRKGKPAKYDPSTFPWPGKFSTTDGFPKAWSDFIGVRVGKHQPLTERACELILKDFERWGPAKSVVALHDAIKGNWSGMYEPKNMPSLPTAPAQPAKPHEWQ